MERHFTYFMSFFPDQANGANWEKFSLAVVIAAMLIAIAYMASSFSRRPSGTSSMVVPQRKFSLTGFFDLFVEGFVTFQDSILGPERRKYTSLCGSVFLFVFALNVIGLIPGMPAATTTVWINVGIALVVFFAFNHFGIKEHGPLGYGKHFFGGPDFLKGGMIVIGLFILIVEVISTLMRILTLNLRLYWNISADHIVVDIFNKLSAQLGFPIGFPFYAMGLFVSFMQAFVFTLLTMIYILLATQHEEAH